MLPPDSVAGSDIQCTPTFNTQTCIVAAVGDLWHIVATGLKGGRWRVSYLKGLELRGTCG